MVAEGSKLYLFEKVIVGYNFIHLPSIEKEFTVLSGIE